MAAAEEYGRRKKDRASRVLHFENIHIQLGNVRLLLATAVVVLAWLSLHSHVLSPWWIAVPIAAFGVIAFWHSRILRLRDLAQRAVAFYDRGLARIEDRWAGSGESGERFNDAHHVYSGDLDLFGKASLFQLLSVARTRMGEERLAQWLLAPSPLEEVRARHAAVQELREELDLREALAVAGEDARVGVYPAELGAWAESPNLMRPSWMPGFAAFLAVLMIASAIVWGVWDVVTPFVVVVAIEALLTYRARQLLDTVTHAAENAFHDLDLLSGILERVESHKFSGAQMQGLQASLLSSGATAFEAIARLRTLVDLINSRHNFFVRIIDAPFMYSVQVAFAAERWKRAHGHSVRTWLDVVAQIEALLSLAAYSFEHSADPLAEFVEGAAVFDAEELGHPLLPSSVCVRNSVAVGEKASVVLVSGSNMSGKSTLLRAVGINTVLAMAGAPVRARRLRLTALQVGASIRVNDSLQEGSSRFYAEIKRLRQIFDLSAGNPPLLFLLDELLQGTNSKDRRIGGEGIVRALVERGSIGLVSTHDLALTEIGSELDGRLRNVHFQDELAQGKITFDYKLREGIVTKSNGLELMRSIGLKV